MSSNECAVHLPLAMTCIPPVHRHEQPRRFVVHTNIRIPTQTYCTRGAHSRLGIRNTYTYTGRPTKRNSITTAEISQTR